MESWSSSYYQTLVKYHRWRLRTWNAEPGDGILVLDPEGPKGKFTLGRISTVKTDSDNIVRKVTIYKLPQSGLNHDLVLSPYKYAERNVISLALVVTAQECEEIETINIDEIRALNRPEGTEEYTSIDEENDVPNDDFQNEENENDAENPENEVFEEFIDATPEEPTVENTVSSDKDNSSKKNSDLKELPRTSTG